MVTVRFLVALVLLGLFASCGQQRSAVVGEGLFQKRKYLPGWHVDLRGKEATKPLVRTASRPTVLPRTEVLSTTQLRVPEVEQPELGEVYLLDEPVAGNAATMLPVQVQRINALEPTTETMATAPGDRDPDNIMPRKRFNVFAIPALLFVLTGIVLAFVTNSGWLVAGALVAGIVLAAISLRRIRSQEQSGKAFALIAMILGVMAALITTMVIIRTGF